MFLLCSPPPSKYNPFAFCLSLLVVSFEDFACKHSSKDNGLIKSAANAALPMTMEKAAKRNLPQVLQAEPSSLCNHGFKPMHGPRPGQDYGPDPRARTTFPVHAMHSHASLQRDGYSTANPMLPGAVLTSNASPATKILISECISCSSETNYKYCEIADSRICVVSLQDRCQSCRLLEDQLSDQVGCASS